MCIGLTGNAGSESGKSAGENEFVSVSLYFSC